MSSEPQSRGRQSSAPPLPPPTLLAVSLRLSPGPPHTPATPKPHACPHASWVVCFFGDPPLPWQLPDAEQTGAPPPPGAAAQY